MMRTIRAPRPNLPRPTTDTRSQSSDTRPQGEATMRVPTPVNDPELREIVALRSRNRDARAPGAARGGRAAGRARPACDSAARVGSGRRGRRAGAAEGCRGAGRRARSMRCSIPTSRSPSGAGWRACSRCASRSARSTACCSASRTCASRCGSSAGDRWPRSSRRTRASASTSERVFDVVRRRSPSAARCGRAIGCSIPSRPTQRSFVDEFLKDRAGQSLAHVFTLLSLVLPTAPLQIAYRGLHTDDPGLRGTALEYLEGVLPPDIRERLWPFLSDRPRKTERHPGARRDPRRPPALERVDHAEPRGAQTTDGHRPALMHLSNSGLTGL